MRITLQLWKIGKIPGRVTMGKHQIPHQITPKQREDFVKYLKIELANEMWLTRPYLKIKEEAKLPNGTRFTAPEVRWVETEEKQPEEEVYEYQNLLYRINMPPDISLEERWEPLHTESKWERTDNMPKSRFEKYSDMALIEKQPDHWPRAVEKWNEWKKVKGIKPNLSKDE